MHALDSNDKTVVTEALVDCFPNVIRVMESFGSEQLYATFNNNVLRLVCEVVPQGLNAEKFQRRISRASVLLHDLYTFFKILKEVR